MTITDCCRALEDGRCTSRELTRQFLARIEEQNQTLNAYVTVTADHALEKAQQVDEKRERGEGLSALAGIPMALKDNISTRGIRTTCCSRMLEDYCPVYDADAWSALDQADAVLLGKNNMDEFAMGSSCRDSCFGPTRHPDAPSRVPGGSSGGTAAAVRAGLAVYGLGSDTGGSLRQPAAFCGVVGFKPSYGTVSRYGLVAYASSFDQIGPVTACVADAAQVYDVITRCRSGDAACSGPIQSTVRTLRRSIRGLRIGVDETMLRYADGSVIRAIEKSMRVLREAGAELVPVSLPELSGCLPVYYILACAEASSNLGRYDGLRYGGGSGETAGYEEAVCRTRSERFGPEVRRRILLGTYVLSAGYGKAYYQRAQQLRRQWCGYFQQVFEQCGALLMPVTPSVAFAQSWRPVDPAGQYRQDIYTVPANIAGLPAISLPCGTGEAGLPAGIQLVAPRFADARLLNAAWCFERIAACGTKGEEADLGGI